MQDLVISGEVLEKLRITPEDLKIDLAVYLYDKEQVSMGQARKLAGLNQLEFQKEMGKRDVYMKYDVEDLEADLETLRQFDWDAHRK